MPGGAYEGQATDPMDERQTASTHAASNATIVVREVQCRRGERVLFAPTSFAVAPGSIVWVRGANGQGKTTLLRTLAGLSSPAAGEIVRAGARPPLYLAHANALKDDLTVAESLRWPCESVRTNALRRLATPRRSSAASIAVASIGSPAS